MKWRKIRLSFESFEGAGSRLIVDGSSSLETRNRTLLARRKYGPVRIQLPSGESSFIVQRSHTMRTMRSMSEDRQYAQYLGLMSNMRCSNRRGVTDPHQSPLAKKAGRATS